MRIGGFEFAARRVEPWPSRRTVRWLSAILLLSAILGIRGLDWGLPYQWHPDEKIMVADTMIRERTLEPPHFINPSLHAYATYVAVRLAYALEPRLALKYRTVANVEMTDPGHPDRPLQFLAYRLSRGLSVLFQLVTVVLLFKIGRHHFDESTGLVAAWFGAVTMGLVNMAHFATGESMLFMLCLWALWRFSLVADRGTWRDYALAGLATGLACSTKYTPWVLAVPFLAAHFAGRRIAPGLSRAGIARMAVTFGCTVGGFLLGSPYAVLSWPLFRHALIVTWFTGAPSGTLAGLERSWVPYIGILGNALGWPLFVLALVGLVVGLIRIVSRSAPAGVRRFYLIHVTWVVAFYAFYGLTSHRALRFIMPIGPSLVLLAASAALALITSTVRPSGRAAATAVTVLVGAYSTAYAARTAHMFVTDTRYAAARWIQNLPLPTGMPVDYFTIESYLPHFDRPSFPLRHIPFVLATEYRGGDFWKEMLPYLESPANGVIADSDAFYPRYFNLAVQARIPERVHLYKLLFTGQGSPFRLVARITSHGPWWLDPRPELVSPEMVIFATRAVVADSGIMSPMPPARDDVMRLMPK
jgi:Dolichyl-phosphate-mannose-protein mannosyltransferase